MAVVGEGGRAQVRANEGEESGKKRATMWGPGRGGVGGRGGGVRTR